MELLYNAAKRHEARQQADLTEATMMGLAGAQSDKGNRNTRQFIKDLRKG